ncbi:MAG: hypothetical protein KAW92_13725 [Candidatus Cloacimonetes bacterium]|nr:hypothetical protein [Candidatus Cloacimonadota bacterium]
MNVLSFKFKKYFAIIGLILLIFIIPIKLSRFLNVELNEFIINNSTSLLGPSGLLFIILGSKGRFAKLSLFQATLLTLIIALLLELSQLVFRIKIIRSNLFTFDIVDLLLSIVSIFFSFIIASFLIFKYQKEDS